ncbi:hypothetical protein ABRP32_08985 [Providencia manganoxydans]|uniref:hypothetical protein n=1 Tax=Providencia manganoxydans TaxID=2923283 RepID=UPI003AF3CE12
MSKVVSMFKNKYVQGGSMVGLMMFSSLSLAAETSKTPSIGDYINAESVAPITDSILTVAGVAIGAAFTILGVIVAAKAGLGLVKGFMSRAAS